MGIYDTWVKPFVADSFHDQFLFLVNDLFRRGLILVNFACTNFKGSLLH
jgi:hypothetical protein